MRCYYVILIIVFLITCSANAMDVLLGRVQSVEPESGRVVLEIVHGFDETGNHDPNTSKKITLQIAPERLPPCVISGRMIRIWGDYVKGEMTQFKVLHISGGGFQNQKRDPTGVRSRIGKGRFKGRMGGRRRH